MPFDPIIIVQIPNPLFDLAGITCGHFLVPFWTFFGATLIGKAVVKMHIPVCKVYMYNYALLCKYHFQSFVVFAENVCHFNI